MSGLAPEAAVTTWRENGWVLIEGLVGTDEIDAYFRDICGRNLGHRVADRVAAPDRIAFTQHCRYPNGQRVVCIAVARVKEGLIVDQTAVQVWDA